ncbi:MAG TPA: GNAT family N-acetyltransferase [Acidothermaceae bacterium]
MATALEAPGVDQLRSAVAALAAWQRDGGPMQLHPGDLGWFWRFGEEQTAAAVRTWRRDGQVVAVGLLDSADVLRLAIAPQLQRDAEVAQRLVDDLSTPQRGVLPEGRVAVEAPIGAVVRDLLAMRGWQADEAWTPLSRDLSRPVEGPALRVEVVGVDLADARVAVQRASFDNSTFTRDRWRAMAAGMLYANARCLLGYDHGGHPVAAVTVWSAGPERPGLIEPMGVHRDHRGRGHGKAITLAAAAALQAMGSSSAIVVTPSSNVAGVATYRSAGFQPLSAAFDLRRA